ncbi:nicotinic acid mononucleotide adenylyltransferase [Fictibacillus macauensis ZFHKF-1]|uniref:Probable nicotinate-nucleotide adenylyltransferase n=1 Tax=Fictibacillus macauensis ZFHKF-1 TaxID=1196324 RepID=I8UEB1_9BACL|nr:nicotinate-nucleotide adenylyltransferase [Fictibacillus macauensis]EIT85245.1 nicotinic acid mononucleotide adenylyltransferase [Fictibacillus macauensis ZFHKF-1]
MAKIGVFGGSFNPPHHGHLLIAQEALAAFALDEVWWMPASQPPHKQLAGNVSDEDRIALVQEAIRHNDKFSLSLLEFEREGPSYTIDTMRTLCTRYPTHEFFFIIGGDMANSLEQWHEIEALGKLVTFIAINREDYPLKENHYPFSVEELYVPSFNVSSTFIRQRLEEGKNTKYILPDGVRRVIEVKGLYGTEESPRNR